MTNLDGYLKKILSLSISLVVLFAFPLTTNASTLNTSATLTYQIAQQGDLDATIDFTISTDSSIPSVLNYYTAVLPFIQIDQISIDYQGESLERTVHKQSSGSDVVIQFDNAIVSKTTPLQFSIRLKVDEYVEVSDSKVVELPINFSDISITKITTNYPKDWGDIMWSSIGNINSTDGIFTFVPNNEASVSIIFGEGLGYSFNIKKTLTNFDVNEMKYEISVPIDNYYQDIIFETITPPPTSTQIDEIGNAFLVYTVESGESIDISISGYVVMNSEQIEFSNAEELVAQTGYWELTEDKEFLRFNIFQKNNSVDIDNRSYEDLNEDEQINFLRNTSNYVISRLTLSDTAETYLRAGANHVLSNLDNASVEDYADLTIAILRKYNIPSRMVVGYIPKSSGYKDEGFYHTWIEVWDITEGKWIIWDPVLEEISGKEIYNKNHLDHIAFHIRESDPLSPNLTYFAEEELVIVPISSFSDTTTSINISEISSSYNFIAQSATVTFYIQNTGNTIINNLSIPIEGGKALGMNSFALVPGESKSIKILLEDITEDINKTLSINYDNNIDSITVSIETNKFWWWDYMLLTISLIIFSGIIITVNYIKTIKTKK